MATLAPNGASMQEVITEEERICARNAVLHLSKKIGQHHPRIIAKVLANNGKHPFVKLDGNNYGDDGVRYIANALKNNTGVQGIDLSYNNITDVGAIKLSEALRCNETLASLRLEGNPIKDEGILSLAETLQTNRSLTSLHLTSGQFTGRGVRALASALEENTSLSVLVLSGVGCGDDGAIGIGRCLSSNTILKMLNLFDCGISDKGASAILSGLKRNKDSSLISLNLRRNAISKDLIEKIYEIVRAKHKLLGGGKAPEVIPAPPASTIDPELLKQLEEREQALREKEASLMKKEKEVNGRAVELQSKLSEIDSEREKQRKKAAKELAKEESKSEGGGWSLFGRKGKSGSGEEFVCVVVGDNASDKNQFLSVFVSMATSTTSSGGDKSTDRIVSGEIKVDSKPATLAIMNTSADDKQSRVRALQYEQAQVIVIVFSLTDIVSFEDIEFQWIPEIRFINPKVSIVLVGMGVHLRSNPPTGIQVSTEMLKEKAGQIEAAGYFEVGSAEDIPQFQKIFEFVVKEAKKKRK